MPFRCHVLVLGFLHGAETGDDQISGDEEGGQAGFADDDQPDHDPE